MILPLRLRRRGFTLVELLVVIAIIGLLVALLLPALSSARSAAVSAGSSSNLSGFGRGFYIYATKNADGQWNSGAFDHNRDGDVTKYGWVADLITQKTSLPGKSLDGISRNKINEKVGDYTGATSKLSDLTGAGVDAKRWPSGTTLDASSGVTYFSGTGGSPTAREVWAGGHNSNYATTWHFSRGDPSGTNGYAAGKKGLADGDGPLTTNHLDDGVATAARVALMGPARAGDGADALVVSGSTRAASGASVGILNGFCGSTVAKVNDLLVESFCDGMNVDFTDTTLGGKAGMKIHEFNDIEPMHQPKEEDGTGGFAPLLFADLHVTKVFDTASSGTASSATRGDGYIGNGVTKDSTGKITAVTIDANGYNEVADFLWMKRLRPMRSPTSTELVN